MPIAMAGRIDSPLGWFQRESFDFSWNELDGIFFNTISHLYSALYWILVAVPFQYGVSYLFLKTARGEEFEIRTIISPYNRIVDVVFSQILLFGIVAIGFVMLIIPGLIFMIRLAFVPYLVMDKGLDAVGAIKASWKMTSNYGWTIFGMAILAIFIFFGGVLFFIVGAIVSIMWINIAFASLYFAPFSPKCPLS